MPFPRRLLNDEEDIVLDLHPHWWFFARPLIALIASIALGIVAWAAGPDVGRGCNVPVGVLILVCLAWFGWRYLRWVTTNFVLTTDRLISR